MRMEYDREEAAKLVPLLRSITREIEDRTQAIDALEHSATVAQATAGAVGRETRERPARQAELAGQRRELRLAKQELARLGCALDEDHPLRVLIPGEHGGMEAGFAWSASDAEPKPIKTVSMR